MKNLKKILLAVLILALLATTVVVTVLAEDGEEEVVYNGTVAEARKLLDEVDTMDTNEKKSAQLAKVYSYVFKAGASSLVDPYEDGFEDLMLDYSNASLKVAQGLLSEYKQAADKEKALALAYSHYKNAPVYEDYESLNEDGYAEWVIFKKNSTIEAVKILTPYLDDISNAETLDDRYNALKNLNGKFAQKYIYFMLSHDDDAAYEVPGLPDFVNTFNHWCMSIANELLDTVDSPEDMISVRKKYISSNNAYNTDPNFFNNVYIPLVERMDLTIIKYANQLVDEVKITAENYKSQGTESLNAVYTYLNAAPCVALTRTQLADTVGAQHEALQKKVNALSYEIAAYYYADVEKLVAGEDAAYSNAVKDFVNFISSCPAIVFRPAVTPDEYTGSVEEAEELLLAVRGEEKEYLEAFAALYAYLSKTAPAPETEGAKEFYGEYEATKREVSDFVVSYLASLDSAPTVKGEEEIDEAAFRKELKKLGEIAAFLKTTPVSSSAVTKYNETATAFVATMEKLWCRQIEYKAPVSGEATGDLEAAKALLDAVDLKSEDALDAYLALYEYLVKTPVDNSVSGSEEFYEAFAEISKGVYKLLAKKTDALATKPAYIDIFANDCPELAFKIPAVETLDGVVEVATALLEAARELVDSGAEAGEIFEAYLLVYEYNYKTALKSDLSGAEDYKKAFETLTSDVSAFVINALEELDATPKTEDEDGNEIIDTDALKESVKVLASFAAFLEECPVSADAIDAYNSARKAFYDAVAASYGSENDSERFDSDLASLIALASYLEKLNVDGELVAEYNAKASEFKASLAALNCPTVSFKDFVSESLDGELDEAIALLDAIDANAKERLTAYSELYKYLKANAISSEEEGSQFFYSEYASLTASIAEKVIIEISKLNPDPYYFEAEYPEIIYSAIEPLTYNGTLADAMLLLNKVKYVLGDENPDVEELISAYAELSDYVQRNSVPRNVAGADKFYSDYEQVKAQTTKIILGEIKAPTTLLDASVKYNNTGATADVVKLYDTAILNAEDTLLPKYATLYSYMKTYGVNPGASDLEEANAASKFLEDFELLTNEVYKIISARIASANLMKVQEEKAEALNSVYTYLKNTPVDKKAVEEYNEAVKKYNEEYTEAKKLEALKVSDITYGKKGNVAAAESRYKDAVESTKSVIRKEYVALYEYMTKYGVNLAAEKAADAEAAKAIFVKYIALTNVIHDIIAEEIDGIKEIESLNDRLNAMSALRSNLEVTPVSAKTIAKYNELAVEYELAVNEKILSFIRDYRVSKEAVDAYNATVSALKAYVSLTLTPDADALGASLESVLEIAEFLKNSPVSVDVVTIYNEVLNGYTVSLKKVIDAYYGTFVDTKAELEDYIASSSAILEKLGLTVLPEDIDYEAFAEKVASLDAYVKVKDITDYIYNADTDEIGNKIASVDEYREDFVKTLNDIIAADVLEYKPVDESDVYSGNVASAQAIIDKYNATEDVNLKAEIFKELFDYIKKNAMNPKLNGYEGIMKNFKAMGEEVYKSLIAKIDAAEDKALAMAEMRAYLEKTPISEAAVSAYNTKYLYTYNDRLNATYEAYSAVTLKLHEFMESFEGAEELIDSFEGFASAIDNYETLETLALVQFYQMQTLNEDPNAATVSVTGRGSAVKMLNNYARKYSIAEDSYAYAETMADVNGITEAYAQLVEDARLALDDKAPLEDYTNDSLMSIVDFDSGTNPLGFSHSDNATRANTGARYDVLEDTARGGMYVKFTCASRSDTNPKTGANITATQQFIGKSGLPGTIPFVFEFDLTGDTGVVSFPVNRVDRSGSVTQMNMFSIRNNKFYYSIDGKEQPAWNNREVITPGEWTKFIFVYDPVNVTLTGYIDYELVGTWSVKTGDPVDTLVEIRISIHDSGKGLATVNLDNFNFYSGSSFRIRDKFDSMTLGDEFTYFVNYMNDSTRVSTSRLQAYQRATALLEEIKLDEALLEELKDVIEAYKTADVEAEVIAPAKAANLAKIKEYGSVLSSYEGNVTTLNYATVQLLVDELESFIAANSEYIDKSNDTYKDVSSSISRFKSLLDRCKNVTYFVDALSKFDKAYTLAAKTKYYASTVQYYELAQLYREDIRLEVVNDPAIVEFEALLNEGLTSSDEAYMDIFTYYETCGASLGIQQNKENSDRIIDCLDFVLSLEGYEDTEAFWEANFDYIDKYMTIIRDVVRTNSYDPEVAGVEEAIERFREIDVYFYAKLQEVHIAFIGENLENYATSESYIEKLGICTYVSNYIEANDIDLTNTELAALVLKNETYLAELSIYRDDYITVLEQNTVKFVNIVEEMKTQVSYKALSKLYAEALLYYYEMNITPESEAAIAVFDGYTVTIKKMEDDSALFIGYANALAKAKNDAELYKALVECKEYRDLASSDIAGVSKAIESYDSALSDYNAKADAINGDIAEVNTVVTVTRTNSIASAIMSVINKIFNR